MQDVGRLMLSATILNVEPLSSIHDKACKISTQDVAHLTGYKYEFSVAPVIRFFTSSWKCPKH